MACQSKEQKETGRYLKALSEDFESEYGLELVQSYSIFNLCMASSRKDQKPLTKQQCLFIRAYEQGWLRALNK